MVPCVFKSQNTEKCELGLFSPLPVRWYRTSRLWRLRMRRNLFCRNRLGRLWLSFVVSYGYWSTADFLVSVRMLRGCATHRQCRCRQIPYSHGCPLELTSNRITTWRGARASLWDQLERLPCLPRALVLHSAKSQSVLRQVQAWIYVSTSWALTAYVKVLCYSCYGPLGTGQKQKHGVGGGLITFLFINVPATTFVTRFSPLQVTVWHVVDVSFLTCWRWGPVASGQGVGVRGDQSVHVYQRTCNYVLTRLSSYFATWMISFLLSLLEEFSK